MAKGKSPILYFRFDNPGFGAGEKFSPISNLNAYLPEAG